MDAVIITMALLARAIQHGAHRHDRRGIYRCVLLRFRGRIEIDHSYGLRCRGLCCHSRHSTRGPAGAAARRPAHSCCAGSGSTNHSSADRIVVNSYIDSHPFGSMSIGPPIPEIQNFQSLTLKIQGQGHSWTSQRRYTTLSIHILFVPCQSALPFMGYSYFKIWHWKFKVKVMGEVKV